MFYVCWSNICAKGGAGQTVLKGKNKEKRIRSLLRLCWWPNFCCWWIHKGGADIPEVADLKASQFFQETDKSQLCGLTGLVLV